MPAIATHTKDLGGGFTVRRALPSAQQQAVGPFVFFDHFGPATVTYLFEGAMMHRDSTGVVQRIEPGAIDWMTAGRGIVHSERTPDDLRAAVRRSHGLQLWVALPAAHEEDAPGSEHTPASAIPSARLDGVAVRVLVGEAFALGHRFIVWNFVSSRKGRVVQAQDAWEAQAMGQVPGETEFIPLPPRRA